MARVKPDLMRLLLLLPRDIGHGPIVGPVLLQLVEGARRHGTINNMIARINYSW